MSGRRLFWIVAVLGVALTWSSFQRAQERLRANLMLGFAEAQGAQIAAQVDQLGPELRPMISATIQTLRQVLPLAPADSRLPLAIGSHYLMLGNTTDATEWYRRAHELEPRPEIYLNLGRAAHLAGDRETALESFRNAVAIDVNLRRSVPEEYRRDLPPPPKGRERG
jgi:tetratricopeptide (TPR) repeat protein